MTMRVRSVVTLLAGLALAPGLACGPSNVECTDRLDLADCESDPECYARVAWPVVPTGDGGWNPDCDDARFIECRSIGDTALMGAPSHAWCGYPPDEPARQYGTVDIFPLPADWGRCTEDLPLPSSDCR